jgi:hypothetical protein
VKVRATLPPCGIKKPLVLSPAVPKTAVVVPLPVTLAGPLAPA